MIDRNVEYANANIDKDLHDLWAALKRRWRVGVIFLIGTIFLSAIAAVRQKPEYVATGKLLFKINRATVLTGIGEELNNFDSLEKDANPMITEIEVLKSFPIAEQALSALRKSDSVKNADLSEEVLLKEINIEPIVGTDVVAVSFSSDSLEEAKGIVNQIMKVYIADRIVSNRQDVLSAQEIVSAQLPKAKARVENREKALQKFKEENQVFAFERELGSLVTNKEAVRNEIKNIQVQLREARSQSESLEQQLGMNVEQAIALRNISQSPKVQQALQSLAQLENQVVQKQEIFEDQDPSMVKLYSQINSLTSLLQNELNKIPKSADKQFTITDLQDSNQDALQRELTSSLADMERLIPALESKLAQLEPIERENQQNARNLPKMENEYRNLQLQLEAAQLNYRSLLKSIEDIRTAEQQELNNVRIIESAQVQESRHQAILFIALGLALGPVLAISTMAGLELSDQSIRTSEQLEEIFNYPILETISTGEQQIKPFFMKQLIDRSLVRHLPNKHNSEVELNGNANISDLIVSNNGIIDFPTNSHEIPVVDNSFSMLQAKLSAMLNKQKTKAIVISSALPREGKSKVTARLALSIAKLGQRVLVIDANLHQPVQKQIWQLQVDQGLSDIILDGMIPDVLINQINDNLDVLLSGSPLENPYDVINSAKLELLINSLVSKYDYILIDSPAIDENVDALNLGKITDGIILVSRIDYLQRPQAKKCRDMLDMTKQNVIGIVVS